MGKAKILNTEEAGQRVGLSADYIRRLCASGKIIAEKKPHWMIDERALKNIKRQRRKPTGVAIGGSITE